jgi:hypothetical protein
MTATNVATWPIEYRSMHLLISSDNGMVLPCTQMATHWLTAHRIMKLLKLVKISSLLSLPHVTKFKERIGNTVSPAAVWAITPLVYAAGLIHIVACVFHFVSQWSTLRGEHSWISQMNLKNRYWADKYYAAIYWTVTTLTTTGYGDNVPVSQAEKFVAMVCADARSKHHGNCIRLHLQVA